MFYIWLYKNYSETFPTFLLLRRKHSLAISSLSFLFLSLAASNSDEISSSFFIFSSKFLIVSLRLLISSSNSLIFSLRLLISNSAISLAFFMFDSNSTINLFFSSVSFLILNSTSLSFFSNIFNY